LGWGLRPVAALARGVPIGAISGFLLDVTSGISDPAVAAPLAFAPGIGALSSAFLLARAVGDLAGATVTTEGEILRLRAIGDKGTRYYVGVDDGSSSRVRAFVVELGLYRRLEHGETVAATTTRHLRHVESIERKR